jgi:hypothetical protein
MRHETIFMVHNLKLLSKQGERNGKEKDFLDNAWHGAGIWNDVSGMR